MHARNILSQPLLKPEILKSDNSRVAFTANEYKRLQKFPKQLSNEGIKVRGVQPVLKLYYSITMVVTTFMRPTLEEVFNIKYEDIRRVKKTSLENRYIEG